MSKWFGIIIAVAGLMFGVSAQENPPRLRVPTPEEYLTLAAEIGVYEYDERNSLVVAEIEQRYGVQLSVAPFALIKTAMGRLPVVGARTANQPLWQNALFLAWLRDEQIDLRGVVGVASPEYDLNVTPFDFDADGQDEFIVELKRDCSTYCAADFTEYFALLALKLDVDGYSILPSSLPAQIPLELNAASETVSAFEIRDLTGDGIPELVATTRSNRGFMSVKNQVHVVRWHEGAFMNEREISASIDTEQPSVILSPLDFLQIYWNADYSQVLELTNLPQEEYFKPYVAYLRALALEGLGRDDEAAAQFAIIAADESQPEWAALAALHLEDSGR